MKLAIIIFGLIGTVLPLSQFLPWVFEHGFNVNLLIASIFANPISVFAWADLIVAVGMILFFTWIVRGYIGRWWVFIIFLVTLLIGVSAGTAMLLYVLISGKHLLLIEGKKEE